MEKHQVSSRLWNQASNFYCTWLWSRFSP